MWMLLLASCTDRAVDSAAPCESSSWFLDADGDGFGAGEAADACEAPPDYVDAAGDCDDADSAVHPAAAEVCNGLDDDCDGTVDADAADASDWYDDVDDDGFGAGDPVAACEAADGQVADSTDCDDEDPDAFPGADEVPYDGVDQDCDGVDLNDVDGDGSPYEEDCDDDDPSRSPDLYEVCDDDIDNDCDEEVDDDCKYFGGVAPGDPAAVIYGEKEAVACCGSAAGWFLEGGDLNDDGVADLVMWSESDGTEFKVMYGPFSGEVDTSDADARLNIQEDDAGDALQFGVSAVVGDISEDGIPDLLIAEPRSGAELGGSIAVYLGPVEGWYGSGDHDVLLEGETLDGAGSALALADLTGSGAADAVVGVSYAGLQEGVYNGDIVIASGPLTEDATLTCGDYPGLTYGGPGDDSGERGDLGYAFLTDDFGTDGQPDLLALSTNPRTASNAYDAPSLLLVNGPLVDCIPHTDVDAAVSFDDAYTIQRPGPANPATLSGAHVDSDGYTDVLVSATEILDGGYAYTARAHLLMGPVSALSSADDAVASVEVSLEALNMTSRVAGDLDGDGQTDFAFGVFRDSVDAGNVYVLFGPLSGTYLLEEDAFGILEGSIEPFDSCETDGCEHPGSLFGWSLLAGEDYTGDGLPDLVVGAPGFEYDTSTNDKGPGAVYVYSGR